MVSPLFVVVVIVVAAAFVVSTRYHSLALAFDRRREGVS
jgi:hypothetical protein